MLAQLAVEEYVSEVHAGLFPSPEYCYEIKADDLAVLRESQYWKEAATERQLSV